MTLSRKFTSLAVLTAATLALPVAAAHAQTAPAKCQPAATAGKCATKAKCAAMAKCKAKKGHKMGSKHAAKCAPKCAPKCGAKS